KPRVPERTFPWVLRVSSSTLRQSDTDSLTRAVPQVERRQSNVHKWEDTAMSTKIPIGVLRRGLLATGVAALLVAAPAQAADECNGFINISYPGAPPIQNVGDILTVKIDLGTGTITGGPLNTLSMNSFGFDLSCADPPGPTPNCTSEG